MNLLEAKNAIQTIAHETKSVHADESMPMSEKKAFFDKAEIDLKNASDIVSIDAQAKRLMQGGETSEAETSAPVTLQRKSLGQLVVESAAYKSAFANGAKSQFSSSVDLKTVGTINEGATLSGGFGTGLFGAAVVPEYLPGIVDLRFNPLVVSDLFAQGTTSSSSISYLKESVFQNNAAGVAEGTAIPQTDDAAVRVQVQVGKIAHLLKITDEMLMDAEAYTSFVNSRLAYGVQLAEQTALMSGAGYPSVNGLLGASGLATPFAANGATGVTDIDGIFNMLTTIRTTAWLEPDAILVNPVDWQRIRLRKDQYGQYYSGGPFTGAYGNGGYSNVDSIWGIKVVVTPAVPANTILVGCFKQGAQIFRRQGITVEMTNSHVDDFANGLVTVRAEERLALAIYRAGAFGKVTLS